MKIILSIVILINAIILYKKAAGTLKLNLINIISYSFFSILFFEYIGVSLAFCGFSDHYLLQKITESNSINLTFFAISYSIIILPITIILCNKYVFKNNNFEQSYINKVKSNVELENLQQQNKIFNIMKVLLFISILATIYVFVNIGYFPLIKYFEKGFNFSVERINISRNFGGNEYIKNIFMILLAPFISYVAYIYMKITKEKKWKVLFIISFILSLIVKTYDFSKSPLIYYLCYFFIIKVILGETFNWKKIIPFLAVTLVLIVISYTLTATGGFNLLSLSDGPLSRIMITQAGTLILHFDCFPNKIDYLNGHSFSKTIGAMLGNAENFGRRSGRVVMEVYNSNAVKNGTAGVMSTLFVGEAYANFSYWGLILSPILVGFIYSCIINLFIKKEKNVLNIVLYVECFILFSNVLQAGFVDYIFNVSFIFIVVLIFGIKKIIRSKKMRRKYLSGV